MAGAMPKMTVNVPDDLLEQTRNAAAELHGGETGALSAFVVGLLRREIARILRKRGGDPFPAATLRTGRPRKPKKS